VKVGDVESIGRLMPVAIKATAKSRALELVHGGYVQADGVVICPLCAVRYLLLLDMRDRDDHLDGKISGRVLAFFREKITQDHGADHEHDLFVMP
jgi:hypothetical protein